MHPLNVPSAIRSDFRVLSGVRCAVCGVRVSVSALGFCDKWEEIGRSGYEGRGGGEQSGPKEVEGANLFGEWEVGPADAVCCGLEAVLVGRCCVFREVFGWMRWMTGSQPFLFSY